MNLKDAFRTQNKLQLVMNEAIDILEEPRNILKIKTTHLRSRVMKEAQDGVVEEEAPISPSVIHRIRIDFRYEGNSRSAIFTILPILLHRSVRQKIPRMDVLPSIPMLQIPDES